MPRGRPAVAINGYDPVAYFDGNAAEGKLEHTLDWNGQQWRFATAEHKTRFASSPERYAPAFEGKCAFAMSVGKIADASPTQWVVENDRLYLQQNPVARLLFRILPGRAAKAEHNWAKVRRA